MGEAARRRVWLKKSNKVPSDRYYFARDHAAGPGAWCVRGPGGYFCSVGDKNVAYAIAKLLSGKLDEAASMAVDICKIAEMDIA